MSCCFYELCQPKHNFTDLNEVPIFSAISFSLSASICQFVVSLLIWVIWDKVTDRVIFTLHAEQSISSSHDGECVWHWRELETVFSLGFYTQNVVQLTVTILKEMIPATLSTRRYVYVLMILGADIYWCNAACSHVHKHKRCDIKLF